MQHKIKLSYVISACNKGFYYIVLRTYICIKMLSYHKGHGQGSKHHFSGSYKNIASSLHPVLTVTKEVYFVSKMLCVNLHDNQLAT